MTEGKVVHFNLFKPENSLFKQPKNITAEIQVITCSNSERCQFFGRGECVRRDEHCQYGKLRRVSGYTRRSSKYHAWCSDQEKKYAGVGFLQHPKSLGVVGEYVFLPYSHMDMMESIPWQGSWLKKKDFTVENIISLVKFRPQAMFGGEIKSYQEEVPPLFLKHLSEQMPELFKQVIAVDEYAAKRYAEFSNIGRKAILETTTPDVGQYSDIHGGLWTWDGESLHSSNSKIGFALVKKFKQVSIIPDEKQIVKITDENQVNSETIFVE